MAGIEATPAVGALKACCDEEGDDRQIEVQEGAPHLRHALSLQPYPHIMHTIEDVDYQEARCEQRR